MRAEVARLGGVGRFPVPTWNRVRRPTASEYAYSWSISLSRAGWSHKPSRGSHRAYDKPSSPTVVRDQRGPARSALGLALACVTLAMLTGCSTEDASCGGGEYPVMTVGGTGSACVSNGDEPPKGYVRYPEGKVPRHVGDKWDTYWSTHTIDENGKIIKAPDAGM